MAEQTLHIPVRMPGLNEFIGALKTHRQKGSSMKREWDSLVVETSRLQRLGHFTEPVFIDFHWYEPNYKRDMDNVAFAKKFILDGLQKAGVITDDNFKWVKGFRDHFHYEEGEGVRIIMTEVIDGDDSNMDSGG